MWIVSVCFRYVNTLLKLVPQVLQLQEQLRDAVQNGDMETSHGICRIAVSLGENHSRYKCTIGEENVKYTIRKGETLSKTIYRVVNLC